MSQPTSLAEYLKRFHDNESIDGYGMDTSMRLACPFCAAPDFMTYRIIDVEPVLTKNHTCKECGRSAQGIVDRAHGGTHIEMVQTGGDDQPNWLEPKMRRV